MSSRVSVTKSGQFDPEPILAVLERHGVEYVVVGGFAARMHGATRPTRDVDVTPATTRQNLDRLAAALRELHARIRTEGAPDGLPFSTSAEALAGQRIPNLQTTYGELDLTIRPAAFEAATTSWRHGRCAAASGTCRCVSPRSPTSFDPRRPPGAARTRKPCPSCISSPAPLPNHR